VEILECLPGVDGGPDQIDGWGHDISFDLGGKKRQLAVLDPVSLFFCKAHALSTDLQRNIIGERNDIQHLGLLRLIMPSYLSTYATPDERIMQQQRLRQFFSDERGLLLDQTVERLAQISPPKGQLVGDAIETIRALGPGQMQGSDPARELDRGSLPEKRNPPSRDQARAPGLP
jgi:hypothetical protein